MRGSATGSTIGSPALPELPPAADALQPPLRFGFRARLRRSVSCTTPPEMDPGDFLRGRSLRREFRTGAKATGGLP